MSDETSLLYGYQKIAYNTCDKIRRLLDDLIEDLPSEEVLIESCLSEALRDPESHPWIEVGDEGLNVELFDHRTDSYPYRLPLTELLRDFIEVTTFNDPDCPDGYTLDDLEADIVKLLDIVREAKMEQLNRARDEGGETHRR